MSCFRSLRVKIGWHPIEIRRGGIPMTPWDEEYERSGGGGVNNPIQNE